MIGALWTAATGMDAQETNIDVISNNLANVNTTGFKKSRVNFQDIMYQRLREPGTPNAQGAQVPIGIEIGHGSKVSATQKIFSAGSVQNTGNPLDIVIEGDGFLQVLRPDGSIAYTRDGSLKQDSSGRIVTSDGYPIQPEIYIPQDATEISITSDGTVTVRIAGDNQPQQLGQIELARFSNPAGLNSIGRNLFEATVASGEPMVNNPGAAGYGTIAQGFLEMSNVKVVEEMVNMIAAQRAYEINSKAIQAADEMLRTASQLRR
ncbi:MAG: flagellar basal-body rod protein FlgG [Halanaerobiales bacterium]|nr:flagellar basal-body rod protein FlgG [Halanaerobiales bacterium]